MKKMITVAVISLVAARFYFDPTPERRRVGQVHDSDVQRPS